MQTSLFPVYTTFNPEAQTYREAFGLELPPCGTSVNLKYMDGLGWYLHWPSCLDGEDILHNASKSKLIKLANSKGWLLNQ